MNFTNVNESNSLFLDHDNHNGSYALHWPDMAEDFAARLLVKGIESGEWCEVGSINFTKDWKNDIVETGGRKIVQKINDRVHILLDRAPDDQHEQAPTSVSEVLGFLRSHINIDGHNNCPCVDYIE